MGKAVDFITILLFFTHASLSSNTDRIGREQTGWKTGILDSKTFKVSQSSWPAVHFPSIDKKSLVVFQFSSLYLLKLGIGSLLLSFFFPHPQFLT